VTDLWREEDELLREEDAAMLAARELIAERSAS
jgi:hypothetical protein